jgi:hypothetical protein
MSTHKKDDYDTNGIGLMMKKYEFDPRGAPSEPIKLNLGIKKPKPSTTKFNMKQVDQSVKEIREIKSFQGIDEKIKNPPFDPKKIIDFIDSAQPELLESGQLDCEFVIAVYRFIWKVYIETKNPECEYIEELLKEFKESVEKIRSFSLPELINGKLYETTACSFLKALENENQSTHDVGCFVDDEKFSNVIYNPKKSTVPKTGKKNDQLNLSCALTGEPITLTETSNTVYTYRCDSKDPTEFDRYFFKSAEIADVAFAIKYICYISRYVKNWVINLNVGYDEVDSKILEFKEEYPEGLLVDIVYYFGNYVHKIRKCTELANK